MQPVNTFEQLSRHSWRVYTMKCERRARKISDIPFLASQPSAEEPQRHVHHHHKPRLTPTKPEALGTV
eukprot:1332774-Amphidinium_carterae.1